MRELHQLSLWRVPAGHRGVLPQHRGARLIPALLVLCVLRCARAGEQRKRDYDWAKAGIDPASHRFGAAPASVSLLARCVCAHGARGSLRHGRQRLHAASRVQPQRACCAARCHLPPPPRANTVSKCGRRCSPSWRLGWRGRLAGVPPRPSCPASGVTTSWHKVC